VGTAALTGTILTLAQGQITDLINNEMINPANENALSIKVWLEIYLDAVRSVGQIMSKYEEIDREDRRPLFNLMVRALVEENPEIIAASNIKMVLVLSDIGEGDLTKRLEARSKDEIGDMTNSFNATLEKIRNLILVIREKAHSFSQTGTELSTNRDATAAAINEITANIRSMNGEPGQRNQPAQ
jgi:methyl-accepting chemotaxis protein